MESNKRFSIKLKVFKEALKNFSNSIKIPDEKYSEEILDLIQNGKIQKYEYCTELTWKMIKLYLLEFHGIDSKSPKQSIKEFYLLELISNSEYENLIQMINDRNRLSHIYHKEVFDEIYNNLPIYLKAMKKVLKIIK